MNRELLFLLVCLVCIPAQSEVFEDWGAQNVSYAGVYYSSVDNDDEHFSIHNEDGRWLINNHLSVCKSNPSGPNPCYAVSGGRLYFHGEVGQHGHGTLLVSNQLLSFTNGIEVSVKFRMYCTSSHGGCWANVGLYRGEANYRAIGSNSGKLHVWGPVGELHTNTDVHGENTYTIKYHMTGSQWRWDYYLNGVLVHGHLAPDPTTDHGNAYFCDKSTRIEIGFGGYQQGGAAAEGHFSVVHVKTW